MAAASGGRSANVVVAGGGGSAERACGGTGISALESTGAGSASTGAGAWNSGADATTDGGCGTLATRFGGEAHDDTVATTPSMHTGRLMRASMKGLP
jgi:hypothetical protein